MAIRQVPQKIERSPEQLAELHKVRDKFQREKPSLGDLTGYCSVRVEQRRVESAE